MSKRMYKKLIDVANYGNSRIKTEKLDLNTYISTENMLPNKAGITKANSIPEGKTQCGFDKGDILLSNIRPYFKKIWYAKFWGGCSNDVLILKPKNNIDNKFLYYVLSDNNFFNYSTTTSKGTKMPRGSKSAILKYLIPDISFPTQERIADILSSYDDLIENNNRRIELLEKAAQELYKEWFVRFRFPGHEHSKMVNGIPEGWEVKRLGDFGIIETGKTPSTENPENYGNEVLFVKTPDMHGNLFITMTQELLSHHGSNSQIKKLLPKNSIMVSCIGTAGVVSINAEEAHTNQQINSIILHDKRYLEWLFFTCNELKETIELFGATGATMTNLSKGKFEKLKIIDPPRDLVYLYYNKTKDIFNEIKNIIYKTKNLKKQRDLLLPRLMSGKLEV